MMDKVWTVLRGGSWSDESFSLRVAYWDDDFDYRVEFYGDFGFRLVLRSKSDE
jgi:hypothetical protein